MTVSYGTAPASAHGTNGRVDLTVARVIAVDLPGALADCGLNDAALGAVLTWQGESAHAGGQRSDRFLARRACGLLAQGVMTGHAPAAAAQANHSDGLDPAQSAWAM